MRATSDPASVVIFFSAVGLLVAVVIVLAAFLETGSEATNSRIRPKKRPFSKWWRYGRRERC
jgi:hypothetical protein